MTTTVYGPGIEPDGMSLDSQSWHVDCPACLFDHAYLHVWETADAGSIEQHEQLWCPKCGYRLPDYPDDEFV